MPPTQNVRLLDAQLNDGFTACLYTALKAKLVMFKAKRQSGIIAREYDQEIIKFPIHQSIVVTLNHHHTPLTLQLPFLRPLAFFLLAILRLQLILRLHFFFPSILNFLLVFFLAVLDRINSAVVNI
jgi:hypothetical protein